MFCLWLGSGCSSVGRSSEKQMAAEQWVGLAEEALADQDPTGALQALASAEEIDERNPQLHHLRALAFLTKNDLPTALESVKRARELAPKNSAIATTAGKILMDLGRSDEAEKPLLQAARDPLYRDAFRARTNLGILNQRRGDWVQARFHLDRAISDSPELSCVARHVRGQISLKQGRLREAIQDFEGAVRHICAGFGEARLSLASALVADRQIDRAKRELFLIQEKFPGTPWAEAAMGHLRGLP
ncbi:MAG: hypothetical protein RJB38_1981 [Pseudomonadota bacterium]